MRPGRPIRIRKTPPRDAVGPNKATLEADAAQVRAYLASHPVVLP